MAGRAVQRGCAAKPVSRHPVMSAVRLWTNQGGTGVRASSPCARDRGIGRNGPVRIVRST